MAAPTSFAGASAPGQVQIAPLSADEVAASMVLFGAFFAVLALVWGMRRLLAVFGRDIYGE